MANAIYPLWKKALTQGAANSSLTGTGTDGLYVALVDSTDYTYNDSHQYYSDVSAGVVGTPVEITNVSITDLCVVDGDDVTWSSVTGDQSEALVFYRKNGGADTTWRLVAYMDSSVTGLPVTPNGGDIISTWSGSGIFKL